MAEEQPRGSKRPYKCPSDCDTDDEHDPNADDSGYCDESGRGGKAARELWPWARPFVDVYDAVARKGAGGAHGSAAQARSFEVEFGEELAKILTADPSIPESPTRMAESLRVQAVTCPDKIRSWIFDSLSLNALPCGCDKPVPPWDKDNPKGTNTCGAQQARIISQVDIQGVLNRQKTRDSNGDNVPYALARTVRSNLLYEAAKQLGYTGAGNQCLRGACFERALEMLCGKDMEPIPREVVLALLRHK